MAIHKQTLEFLKTEAGTGTLLCGIGFTMSLFIGALAFESHAQKAHMAVKLGVIAGSLMAAFAGAIWLRRLR